MKTYIFEYEVDGKLFDGKFKANSFEQAEELIKSFKLTGELVGEYDYTGKPIKILIPNKENNND